MNVDTGLTVAMLVSRPFHAENKSTVPDRILDIGSAHERIEIRLFYACEQLKASNIFLVQLAHVRVRFPLNPKYLLEPHDNCQAADCSLPFPT